MRQIERLREDFPSQSPNPQALKRLSDFYEDMKEKGVADLICRIPILLAEI